MIASRVCRRWGVAAVIAVMSAGSAMAAEPVAVDPLQQFSASVEALVTRVSPSVVQVIVTGYGPVADSRSGNADVVLGKQTSIGSGVVIAADGYIVTNAHVVGNGQQIDVVLPAAASHAAPLESMVVTRGRTVPAHVVGVSREVDLALLKVDATGLTPLPFANYDTLRQGEVVFAFGSPEGLRNSVTMGVVSAVARQPDADHPMVYVQTDAPINRGNSGGPLVNVKGELVGINTFILSESGGSQGLGFAIPSAIVEVASRELRSYGHLHDAQIGAQLQTISPMLARGLGLAQDWGVIVSDVMPEGPADLAGLRVNDIVVAVDNRPIDSLPLLIFELYARHAGDHLKCDVLRGTSHVTIDIPMIQRPHDIDHVAQQLDPEQSAVRQLSILGVDITGQSGALASGLRMPSGVMVAAHLDERRAADVPLGIGDVIHAINGTSIATVNSLRAALDALPPHTAVVLQVEREGALSFVAFELD